MILGAPRLHLGKPFNRALHQAPASESAAQAPHERESKSLDARPTQTQPPRPGYPGSSLTSHHGTLPHPYTHSLSFSSDLRTRTQPQPHANVAGTRQTDFQEAIFYTEPLPLPHQLTHTTLSPLFFS